MSRPSCHTHINVLRPANFLEIDFFKKKYLSGTLSKYQMVWIQNVGPDLGPNCLYFVLVLFQSTSAYKIDSEHIRDRTKLILVCQVEILQVISFIVFLD